MARARSVLLVLGLLLAGAACSKPAEPVKHYPIKGQILAVVPDRQELTIKHEDIPDFMPAMTMNYAVARPELLQGRTPGETFEGTLDVRGSTIQLSAITHTGTAPLPPMASNANAMAANLLV
jgi:protein SCO1/2